MGEYAVTCPSITRHNQATSQILIQLHATTYLSQAQDTPHINGHWIGVDCFWRVGWQLCIRHHARLQGSTISTLLVHIHLRRNQQGAALLLDNLSDGLGFFTFSFFLRKNPFWKKQPGNKHHCHPKQKIFIIRCILAWCRDVRGANTLKPTQALTPLLCDRYLHSATAWQQAVQKSVCKARNRSERKQYCIEICAKVAVYTNPETW